ncbi:hypothetical protein AVEN_58163-1 [Araneus ventricosus]|uniref:Uncharacterized protein n=1 Tax=Araneus ventricosus TaxID=182803 RepID=A0A4Y2SEZ9_ARAVE|nr:hypothetical protein AVEN_58163-1 [Araneus ventricosus]
MEELLRALSVHKLSGILMASYVCIRNKEAVNMEERKKTICNNCKCPREAHDVCHEEFVNVCDRIGFQPSPEPSRHPISKEKTLSAGYSWVPPGLSSEKRNVKAGIPTNSKSNTSCADSNLGPRLEGSGTSKDLPTLRPRVEGRKSKIRRVGEEKEVGSKICGNALWNLRECLIFDLNGWKKISLGSNGVEWSTDECPTLG